MTDDEKLRKVADNNHTLIMLTKSLQDPTQSYQQTYEVIVELLIEDINTLSKIAGVAALPAAQGLTGKDLKRRGISLIKARHALLKEALRRVEGGK